jgi:hypothetical protein
LDFSRLYQLWGGKPEISGYFGKIGWIGRSSVSAYLVAEFMRLLLPATHFTMAFASYLFLRWIEFPPF